VAVVVLMITIEPKSSIPDHRIPALTAVFATIAAIIIGIGVLTWRKAKKTLRAIGLDQIDHDIPLSLVIAWGLFDSMFWLGYFGFLLTASTKLAIGFIVLGIALFGTFGPKRLVAGLTACAKAQ